MLTKRSEAMDLVNHYKAIITPFMNKPCKLNFSRHTNLDIIITDVCLGKATGKKNMVDKRTDDTGKQKTPMFFEVVTTTGILEFIFDDTQVFPLIGGIRFSIKQDYEDTLHVDIRSVV